MTDQEKLLKVFDEIGIHYQLEHSSQEEGDGTANYTCVWLAAENSNLAAAKAYDHLIEFRNGELASY